MSNGSDKKTALETRRRLLEWFFDNEGYESVEAIAAGIGELLGAGGSLFACGNGGSASQAEHFVAELVGRFKKERSALPVFALTRNSAVVTSISNDYGFADVFSRQVAGLGKKGDGLLVLSTSGTSRNILNACEAARQAGMQVFSFTGRSGDDLVAMSDIGLKVPDTDSARIQELHLLAIHCVCQLVEEKLFSADSPSERV